MTFKRALWELKFYDELPDWPCPSCNDGILMYRDAIQSVLETGASERARSYDGWEPDWIKERFSTMLKCAKCAEIVVVSGSVSRVLDYVHDDEFDHGSIIEQRVFEPVTFHPAPSVIGLPESTPESVAREIDRAASLIWMDSGSAANRLRGAVEELLSSLAIARTTKNSSGKRIRLTLDARITRLAGSQPAVADLLHSIRFVGNVGSHEAIDAIDRDDVLSAFEIMEHALEKLYDDKEERLKRTAKSIAKRKGKSASKRRRH